MRTQRFFSIQWLLNILLLILLLTNSCGQSNSSMKSSDADTLQKNTEVPTPKMNIQAAVLSGNLEVVKKHIQAGTDINKKDPLSAATPLITAASFGKIDIAEALLKAGAGKDIKNNDGATALHVAAFFCRVEIVQMLIDADADKTAKNNFGVTPRESVMGPFSEIKPIYEMLLQQLSPLGFEIDLNEVEKTRPVIAMMLQ